MVVESSSSERAHRSTSTTSELFICFSTSRLSSSSMKLSSKSLLSPGRSSARDSQEISLSSSLSRRLRTSGSIKGGASPMFPSSSGSKKRAGFENPEPSSPKVTCIGQVRVKTKKQGKKMRLISSRSKRSRSCSGSAAEASFRRAEQSNSNESFHALHFPTHRHQMSSSSQRECMRQRNNNQRWVHLPLTICEALKAFGSEFNCLVPNKSSCGGGGGEAKEEEERREQQGGRPESSSSSCGAVFARWFVALGDGEDGNKRREIELVVGEEEDEVRTEISSSSGGRSLRRQVFEGIEFKEEMLSDALMREEEASRVSICVPPKNALLLMRCRSDPVKMAALGNRFWEMPAKDEEESEEDEDKENGYEAHQQGKEKEKSQDHVFGIATEPAKVIEDEMMCEKWVCDDEDEKQEEVSPVSEMDEAAEKSQSLCEALEATTEEQQCQEDKEELDLAQPELHVNEKLEFSLADIFADPEMAEQVLEEEAHEEGEEVEMRQVQLQISEPEEEAESWTEAEAEQSTTEETEQSTTECTTWEEEEAEEESPVTVNETEPEPKRSSQSQSPVLPDCLLLMMCEPKLSMEVSKETWVCSTDFIRCLPERHVSSNKKKDGKDNEAKKPPRVSIDSKAAAYLAQPMMQPPRSSCSFPIQAGGRGGGPLSMAEIIGQKLVGSGGGAYEPFVLTRCKSEPMRTTSKLAAPEACFWKNRKMEPHHRPDPLGGVGATGVGF